MKKVFLALSACTLCFGTASAQSKNGNDFIMFNNTWNMNRFSTNNGYYPFYAPPPSQRRIQDHQFSLQYVRSINDRRALRISLGYKEHFFNANSTYQNLGDTTFQRFTSVASFLPKVGVGMEWRKMLHKDVMIIGGIDFDLGVGGLMNYNTEYKNYVDTSGYYNTTGGGGTGVGGGLGMYFGAKPFTGVRISWGRLAIDYSATLPLQINIANSNAVSTGTELDIRFQHSLSVGYRIFNRKK